MKKIYCITGILLLTWFAGCSTSSDIGSALPSPFAYKVDSKLYEKVPANNRLTVDRAIYEYKLSKEKLELSTLKEELAAQNKRASGYEQNIAQKQFDKASLVVTLEKLRAIDQSGLGVKDDNIKDIADLESEKLDIEGDIIRLTAKLDTLRRHIEKLNQKVDTLELRITQLGDSSGSVSKMEAPIDETLPKNQPDESNITEETLK